MEQPQYYISVIPVQIQPCSQSDTLPLHQNENYCLEPSQNNTCYKMSEDLRINFFVDMFDCPNIYIVPIFIPFGLLISLELNVSKLICKHYCNGCCNNCCCDMCCDLCCHNCCNYCKSTCLKKCCNTYCKGCCDL